MLKLIASLAGIFNTILNWFREEKLVRTGADLQKGKQDAKTISDVQKAQAVRDRDNSALDDELRVD